MQPDGIAVDQSFSLRSKAVSMILRRLSTLNVSRQAIDAIILLPLLGKGGSEKVASMFASLLRRTRPNKCVLIMVTDYDVFDSSRIVLDGVHILSIPVLFPSCSHFLRLEILMAVIKMTLPRVIHIINSDLGWTLLKEHGHRLKLISGIYASIFCVQKDPDTGTMFGYAKEYLGVAHEHCKYLLSDNQRFFLDLDTIHPSRTKKAKEVVVYNPVGSLLWQQSLRRGPRPSILWAGRLDRQKRVEVVFETALLMPKANFYLYGSNVTDKPRNFPVPSNVHFEGDFSEPGQIFQRRSYDLYMHTAFMEGLPNILLEVGMCGVPVVAPDVGGISELINDKTGYLLSSLPSGQDYADAIKDVIDGYAHAKERAQRLYELVTERHSFGHFSELVAAIDGYL